jgi:hypothetical protein
VSKELSKQLTNAQKPYTLLHFISHGKLMAQGETALYWAQADNQILPATGEDSIGELKNIGNYQKLSEKLTSLCLVTHSAPTAPAGNSRTQQPLRASNRTQFRRSGSLG